MTLEKLLGLSAEDWEQLSDVELSAWAKQFERVTRPDPAKVKAETEKTKERKTKAKASDLLQQALALAKDAGYIKRK
jgi:hypothetical protein